MPRRLLKVEVAAGRRQRFLLQQSQRQDRLQAALVSPNVPLESAQSHCPGWLRSTCSGPEPFRVVITKASIQTPTTTTTIHSFTTVYPAGQSPTTSTTTSAASSAGLSSSDKIALGIGLGVGIPTLMFMVFAYFNPRVAKAAKAVARGDWIHG